MKLYPKINALLLIVVFLSCEYDRSSEAKPLSSFELRHGIGPIKKEINLSAPDSLMAEEGRKLFQTRCTACHRLDRKLSAPPLRYVVRRRSDSYVLNAILNPVEMSLRHPEARILVRRYGAQMTPQFLKESQAFQILHYLHRQTRKGLSHNIPDAFQP